MQVRRGTGEVAGHHTALDAAAQGHAPHPPPARDHPPHEAGAPPAPPLRPITTTTPTDPAPWTRRATGLLALVGAAQGFVTAPLPRRATSSRAAASASAKLRMSSQETDKETPRYYGPNATPLLDTINCPADMNRLSIADLKQLSYELRCGRRTYHANAIGGAAPNDRKARILGGGGGVGGGEG